MPQLNLVLIRFRHGLGDAVQLTSVLKNLRAAHPDWSIDVEIGKGKHSIFRGLAEDVFVDGDADVSRYDQIFDLDWHECGDCWSDSPSTKAEKCLRDVFGLKPSWDSCGYQIQVGDEARRAAMHYLEAIGCKAGEDGRFNAVCLHYEGNTATRLKNLNHDHAKLICDLVLDSGNVPIILDWDRRSRLPDNRRIFCPDADHPLWLGYGTGDAERLAALIRLCRACMAIDSGPGHVAAATNTPTLIVWKEHHPIHYFAPTANVLHLLPEDHGTRIHGPSEDVLSAFRERYRHRIYADLAVSLMEELDKLLRVTRPHSDDDNLVLVGDFWVRRDNIEQDMVIVRDVYQNDAYRLSIIPGIVHQAKLVVDVGAHIGCFAKLVHRMNPETKIVCVEACPENLSALRANVGDFADVIHAACTYEPGELALLNAVRPNCESTGGSVVVRTEEIETTDLRQDEYVYWSDKRPLPKITLEQILDRAGEDRIDLLKLDCEGSEYSILGETPSLSRIRMIVGEYHFQPRWNVLRAQRMSGWDYGHMLDGGESGGLFHYANPVWPPRNAEDEFLARLEAALFPPDRAMWPVWKSYYQTLFQLARRLQPRRIVEIGTRAGYSGLAFLMANPGAEVTGYDAAVDPESADHLAHAERLLAGLHYRLIRADSHGLDILPLAELVYIDGDHTKEGSLADLELAFRNASRILVDDAGTGMEVPAAIEIFLARHPDSFDTERIEFTFGSGANGAFLLLTRRGELKPSRPLLRHPLLRLAVPAGIGDSVWTLTKVPHLLRLYGAEQAHIALCGSAPYRGLPFVQRFDFVASAENCRFECIEADRYTPEGVYNWAPSGIGWHNEFDWILQANRHLESGQRLETWLPEFETDWRIADRFRFTGQELREAREFERHQGPYCVFYLGPEAGNTWFGHNRGPLWAPSDWGRLAEHCRALGLKVVVVGARYDRSYFDGHVAPLLGDCIDAVGHWSIGQTFAVIQRSRFVVAYQSGIGIFSVYLGIPTACFWRPYGDSIDPGNFVSFQESMASAWAPQEALDSGRYLPLIYTRCTPDSIAAHAESHGWHKP